MEANIRVCLRSDQAELVILSLRYVQTGLNEDMAKGAHSKVSGPFTYSRLEEIIGLIETEWKP